MRAPITKLCAFFGVSKSWYYKILLSISVHEEFEHQVLQAVMYIRAEHHFYGLRKVWFEIRAEHGINIGRDRLHRILKRHGLMLPSRNKKVRTSIPGSQILCVGNKIKHLEIDHKNMVWVTDITYITTPEGIVYLSAVMDVFSRKIIAHYVSNDLKTDGSLECIRQALETVDDPSGIIHHSDHGVQYCSLRYVEFLLANGLEVSYTGKDHCYDNAKMERVFNTLKHEYKLANLTCSKRVARDIVNNAILDYNTRRIHAALGYKKPCEVYNAA